MADSEAERGLVEALEELFEEPAAALLASLAALAAIPVVFEARAIGPATAFDFAEEVVVGIPRGPLALLDEDSIQLSAVEPDTAALRAGVDQDLAALGLHQTRAVDRTPQRLVAWPAEA